MSDQVTTTETFAACPACKHPVMGRVLWEIEFEPTPDDIINDIINETNERIAKMRPIGAEVSHNCMLKVTRNGAI